MTPCNQHSQGTDGGGAEGGGGGGVGGSEGGGIRVVSTGDLHFLEEAAVSSTGF